MLSCIWKQHRKLHSQNSSRCVERTQHALLFISRKDTRVLSGRVCFCRTVETVLLDYQYVWSRDGTVFPPWAPSFQTVFLCTQTLPTASEATRSFPAPNAAGKFLVRECMWNVELSLKFVQVFRMCGRCDFICQTGRGNTWGLVDGAFEWRFRMPCWWRDSLAQVLCQPSPGGMLCVFLNGTFDWCFQLTHSWPGKGIE